MSFNHSSTPSGSTATVGALRPREDDLLPEGAILAGRYSIEEALGSGGFAHVYRARDLTLGTTVAVKVLHEQRLSPSDLTRFRREVSVAHEVSSPHLVRIFDLVEDGERTFLTMELVEGGSLRDRIGRGPLDVEEAIAAGSDVLHALHALHSAGVVHRDVKPGNVLIGAGGGTMKLADLGLARAMAPDVTRATGTDALLGTLEYLSPEQALGRECDARSDLYSFGVLMFEMLTGRTPFAAKNSVAAAMAHVQQRPPSVRAIRKEVPRWLARLIASLLEKNPSRRPASAEAVLSMLRRHTAPLPWRRMLLGAACLALVVTGAWLFRTGSRDPEKPMLAAAAGGGIEVRDSEGRLLWTRKNVHSKYAAAVRLGPRRWGVAATDAKDGDPMARGSSLLLLDAERGEVMFRCPIPTGANLFPAFDDRFFVAGIDVMDRDHDSWSEVVLNLRHHYYPNYLVAFDTRTRRDLIVFAASGHHTVAAAADVNRDGYDDIIVAGTANRLGWYAAVGAIDLHTALARDSETASTPDGEVLAGPARTLLWYALVPHAFLAKSDVEIQDGSIRLKYPAQRTLELGLDGFVRGLPSRLSGTAREAARAQAYELLRNARRLGRSGEVDRASAEAGRAIALAQDAGDFELEEWARRVDIRVLISGGRLAAAMPRLEALTATSPVAADISFDAARALHLAGELDRAMEWYRKGLHAGLTSSAGRLRYEFLQGGLMVLAEQGRWEAAERWVAEYQSAYPTEVMPKAGSPGQAENPADYLSFVRWRLGDPARPPEPIHRRLLDMPCYWALEIDYLRGEPPSSLLPKVEAEIARGASATGMLMSLRAILLSALGRTAEAREEAERARRWIDAAIPNSTEARGHADLVRRRASQILGHNGR